MNPPDFVECQLQICNRGSDFGKKICAEMLSSSSIRSEITMKSKSLFFAFLLALVLLQSCSESKFDYRHKYVGEFTVIGEWYRNPYHSTDFIAIDEACTVDYAEERKALHFSLQEHAIDFEVLVGQDGLLEASEGVAFTGHFSDADHFDANTFGASSLVEWSIWVLSGVRK
jgi:hypothetical protein